MSSTTLPRNEILHLHTPLIVFFFALSGIIYRPLPRMFNFTFHHHLLWGACNVVVRGEITDSARVCPCASCFIDGTSCYIILSWDFTCGLCKELNCRRHVGAHINWWYSCFEVIHGSGSMFFILWRSQLCLRSGRVHMRYGKAWQLRVTAYHRMPWGSWEAHFVQLTDHGVIYRIAISLISRLQPMWPLLGPWSNNDAWYYVEWALVAVAYILPYVIGPYVPWLQFSIDMDGFLDCSHFLVK